MALSTPAVPLTRVASGDPTLRASFRNPMACHLGLAGAAATTAVRAPRLSILASASAASGQPVRRIRRRAPPGQQGSAPPPAPTQPSVDEVRRAIGVADDAASSAASGEAKNSAFMDLIASTPIGQPESEPERRLREAAEWVVDTTEDRNLSWCYA
ncbi:uncharacterized protein LOC133897716 isoform X2 [Phragmites australis]|uniref:uncharacterized protein LOC133897716 isoform X2 n=1 Tax=Phragmites australis TaxID=29695 RepID=UPI002D786250|nr:uncharacterized protein LOC133897716 isoform X2 [Phragmites australis]